MAEIDMILFKEQLNKWLFFNFRIHILTPLVFMFGLCCTRICPYCGYCAYWNFLKKAMDNWTRRTRMIICSLVAFPLAISMITVGAISIEQCSKEVNNSSSLTTGIVIKLWNFDYRCLLNKPYVSEVTLREQNLSFKCCQSLVQKLC